MTTNDFNTLTDMLRGSELETKVGTLDQGRVTSAVVVGVRNVELEITRDPTGNFYTTAEDAEGRTHGYMFRNWTPLIKALKEMA